MGKSRRNRGGPAHRRDPIAKAVKPPTDPELAALRESKILPVIKDLQSANPNSRSAAAAAVSTIVHDQRCRKLLLREQIVHTVLSQTLTDAALESRAAGWGILQVLSQNEEADFCVHLYRQDIMTAIEFAAKMVLERIFSEDTPLAKAPKAEQASILSIAASTISLLTSLAESKDEILEAISHNAIITRLVFSLISYDGQSPQDTPANISGLRTDALACLMILSEDNTELATSVANADDNKCASTLTTLKGDINGDGVLACAILHNIFAALQSSAETPRYSGTDDTVLIPTLVKAIAGYPSQENGNEVASGWSSPLEYQQLAIETIAAICAELGSQIGGEPATERHNIAAVNGKDTEPGDQDMGDVDEDDADENVMEGEDNDGNEGDGDDAGEMSENEMEADMEMVTGTGEIDDAVDGIDDLPVLKSLLHNAVPDVLRIACLQPNDDIGLRFQSHALSALNNLAWSVSLLDFSDDHNAGVQKAWEPIGHAVWEKVIASILATDTADVSLATQVTGLAWAVARSLQGKTPLQSDEHRKFISLYQATKGGSLAMQDGSQDDDPFQGLGVKCVGVLGQLAMHPAPVTLNREIGTFLVTLLEGLPETPAADAIEALNQLFDMYGDEDHPCDAEVFWKDDFLKHLDAVLPKARAMARSIDRKAQSELRSRADEAVLNLGRFMAYKRKHKS